MPSLFYVCTLHLVHVELNARMGDNREGERERARKGGVSVLEKDY